MGDVDDNLVEDALGYRHLLRRLLALLDRGQPRHRHAHGSLRQPDAGGTRARRPLLGDRDRGRQHARAPTGILHRCPNRVSLTSGAPASRRFAPASRRAAATSPARASRRTGYSWLRDGSFIADAMSRVGEVASAEAFFGWVARIVERGLGFEARYTLEGERDPTEWPHRQHDGWGLWLWALRQHAARHGGGEPLAGRSRGDGDPPGKRARGAVHRLVGGARGHARRDARLHRGGARRRPRSLARGGAAGREPARPSVPRLRLGRRDAARRSRRRRPPPPRRHLLRRRRVAAADRDARARRAGAAARSGWSGSLRTPHPTAACPSSRTTTCSTPRRTTTGWRSGGRRPLPSSGRTRCS